MRDVAGNYSFAHLLVTKEEKNATKKIVSYIYKDNMQIKKKDFSTFHKVNLLLLCFLNTVGCRRYLELACFVDNSGFGSHISDISCDDNCLYNLYKGANIRDDFGVPNWKLYDITIRHFLRYLEINKWYRHQKRIAIAKEIDIYTVRFELKESEKLYGYSNAGQASITVEKATIIKQTMANCKKACRKALDIFAINTWSNCINDIMFLYK